MFHCINKLGYIFRFSHSRVERISGLTEYFVPGRPEPSVRWLVNGVLVDEEYEHNTGDVIENRLLWPAIRRADYAAVFTCQAANSHLVPPKELSLVLDMFRKYSTL